MNVFLPKKQKYRKMQSTRILTGKNISCSRTELVNSIGLKTIEKKPNIIHSKILETIRRVIQRACERKSKISFRVFPDVSVSKKSIGVRMGGGKGSIKDIYYASLPGGAIMLEISGVPINIAEEALKIAQKKLPFKTAIVFERKGVI